LIVANPVELPLMSKAIDLIGYVVTKELEGSTGDDQTRL
jgi:hypothetical protein